MSYETNCSPRHLISSNFQLKRKMAHDKKPNSTRQLGFFKLIQIITTVKRSNAVTAMLSIPLTMRN